MSFIEMKPEAARMAGILGVGYRSRRELPDEDMLASFVLLRRLLLLAWMGSHSPRESATPRRSATYRQLRGRPHIWIERPFLTLTLKPEGHYICTSLSGRSAIVTGVVAGHRRGIRRNPGRGRYPASITGHQATWTERALASTQQVSAVSADDQSQPRGSHAAHCEAVFPARRPGHRVCQCRHLPLGPAGGSTPDDLERCSRSTSRAGVHRAGRSDALTESGHGRVMIHLDHRADHGLQDGRTTAPANGSTRLLVLPAMNSRPKKITINAVLPGNYHHRGPREMGQEYLDQMSSAVPAGQLGSVADASSAALFFATTRPPTSPASPGGGRWTDPSGISFGYRRTVNPVRLNWLDLISDRGTDGGAGEELRRRIVADINAGAPGAKKSGGERDLAERYGTSRSAPPPGAVGVGGGRPGHIG